MSTIKVGETVRLLDRRNVEYGTVWSISSAPRPDDETNRSSLATRRCITHRHYLHRCSSTATVKARF